MKVSCIIVDDEPLSHEVLKSHLVKFPHINVEASFYNARDAQAYLQNNSIDVMFLDIQLPEVNGIDFLRSLHTKPVTIITTAFRDYAIDGFELGVIDYLLKPIELGRFQISLRRTLDFLDMVRTNDTVDLHSEGSRFDILIKSGTRKIRLDYRTIIFAQGLKDYTILHTEDKKYVVKGSIKAFEDFLPQEHFIRVHKSFLVARPKIRVVHRNKIEIENISIPIGRNFKDAVERFLRS